MNQVHIVNGQIFTGEHWLNSVTLTTQNGVIQQFSTEQPGSQHPVTTIDLDGGKLVPAFIDIQLYGGDGKLFGELPSVEALQATVTSARRGGAAMILPTVATNDNAVALAAIKAVRDYWAGGGAGVVGLHLEGPFLNREKRGAHDLQFLQQPSVEAIGALLDGNIDVVKIMTIAPECFGGEVLDFLKSKGILLSAGHSNITYEAAMAHFNAGIPLVTHLYNAMSGLQHRAPGLVGAAMDHGSVMASIVADGYHVDAAAIRIAKKIMGQRLFLITDAVTENKTGSYRHELVGDRYCLPDGTLSGSALSMHKAVQFCIQQVGINEDEALRMAALYPARALGMDHLWGKIADGYQSTCCVLDAGGGCRLVTLP
ncbi:N-acetylglucosamine-6-phosphate deacetylase [Flavihumibacter petaseus]|uniref:N-acetylglucosamine-6-phosphate deacetylase n=1 Tax=Flavihumibacter petaseus NBRC 106054 TaxID=1220578 RepID=A0A0E9MXB9_9BACT|nr:N-acetylglucosamine-6-phosphate deacetylase [Flavihumibacter petaseus]GAO42259.1 N-acetylglucosamine-6-phosphate deacetylase [Flavihumibacter petaseus NBRC 106054]